MPYVPFAYRHLLLALPLLGLAACGDAPDKQTVPAARPAFVTKASSQAQDGERYIAEVRAVSRAELAFAVSGQVIRLHADVGDVVRAGQLLAELDTTPLRAQQQTARSEELGHAPAGKKYASVMPASGLPSKVRQSVPARWMRSMPN
ncbi:hypothetical protein ACSZOH_03570 [Aeromonas caviae]